MASDGNCGRIVSTGQSQPPRHLSMFLEVSDKDATADWSCFVSHRLVIVNQRDESRSLVKESQVRLLPTCFMQCVQLSPLVNIQWAWSQNISILICASRYVMLGMTYFCVFACFRTAT